MSTTYHSNSSRSHVRLLDAPFAWSDKEAKEVFDFIILRAWLVDLYIENPNPQPLPEAAARCYGDAARRAGINAFSGWTLPLPNEDAQAYIRRHLDDIAAAGWRPYFPEFKPTPAAGCEPPHAS